MQTVYHLISFMVGPGLLNLPLALLESEWYGILLVVFASCVCTYTSKLIVVCFDVVRWTKGDDVSYGDVGKQAFGRIGQVLIVLQVQLSLLCSACAYVMISSNYISTLFGIPYAYVVVFICSLLCMHVFLTSLRSISVFSALNLGIALWIEAVIIADAMYPSKLHHTTTVNASSFAMAYPGSVASQTVRFSYSLILVISGFFCHPALGTMYNALEKPRNCVKVVFYSQLGALCCLYLPICAITYMVYGSSLQVPVFMNLRNDTVREVAILLFALHLLLSYIITVYPLELFVQHLLRKVKGNNKSMLPGFAKSIVILATLLINVVVPPNSHAFLYVMTIPVVFLALIAPPACHLRLCFAESTAKIVLLNLAILVFGIWILLFGCYSTWYCATSKGSPPA